MKQALVVLHTLAVLAALGLCLIAAADSISYFGSEPFAFTYSRSTVALLCGSFASAHLYLLVSKQITSVVALLFYPLILTLGLATEFVTRASVKGWSPATASEAVFTNVIGYGVIALIVVACAASCFRAITRSRTLNSNVMRL